MLLHEERTEARDFTAFTQYGLWRGGSDSGSGSIGNVVVEGGSRPMATLRQGPCLEVVSFSDFQTNPLTGDFGGEIRLAYLSKDGSRDRGLPVSGGSISGNILNVQGEMTLSRERQQLNCFSGPESIRLSGLSISGSG